MNKSLEALLRGYYKFEVNDKVFYLYNSALAYRKYLSENEINVRFNGKHIFYKQDRVFYLAFYNIKDCK